MVALSVVLEIKPWTVIRAMTLKAQSLLSPKLQELRATNVDAGGIDLDSFWEIPIRCIKFLTAVDISQKGCTLKRRGTWLGAIQRPTVPVAQRLGGAIRPQLGQEMQLRS